MDTTHNKTELFHFGLFWPPVGAFCGNNTEYFLIQMVRGGLPTIKEAHLRDTSGSYIVLKAKTQLSSGWS